MRVTIVGFLTDYKSRVLLQQPEPGRLLPVTTSLAAGVLPAEALVHAFRAATGLVVWPVRLVGVYFIARGGGELVLSYRCTLRGGDLQPLPDQPAAAFYDTSPPPRGLSAAHARQLDDALHHGGGPARLGRIPAAGRGLRGLFGRRESPAAGVDWGVGVMLVVHDGQGQIVCERHPGGIWKPLAVDGELGEAPWESAARRLAELLPRVEERAVELRLVEVEMRGIIDLVFVTPPYPKEAFALSWGNTEMWALDEVGVDFDQEDAAPEAALVRAALASDATVVRLANRSL